MSAYPLTLLPNLSPGRVSLVIHPHPSLDGRLLELAAELLLAAALQQAAVPEQVPPTAGAEQGRRLQQGRLLVLDGGNCFNVYPVARALRRRTPQVTAALRQIQVARAFTCFEMASLLQRQAIEVAAAEVATAPPPQAVMPGTVAVLVLDLLGNFRDENVPLAERQRLLHTCLPHLRRLAQAGPLLVSSRPADPCLTQALVAAADQVLELEMPPAEPEQLLFLLEGT